MSLPLPKQTSGKFTGWRVEAKNDDEIWKPVDIVKLDPGIPGVKRSHHANEIHELTNTYSKEAALSLAWAVKANDCIGLRPVRIVPYKVNYTAKLELRENEIEVISDENTCM